MCSQTGAIRMWTTTIETKTLAHLVIAIVSCTQSFSLSTSQALYAVQYACQSITIIETTTLFNGPQVVVNY